LLKRNGEEQDSGFRTDKTKAHVHEAGPISKFRF